MKTNLSAFLLMSVLVSSLLSCTKQLDDLQEQIDAHHSLPCGIVMLSTKFEEKHKGDTCEIFVRVNPSNFDLAKDSVELWTSHELYTCYTDKTTSTEYEPVFDEKAKSEFTVVGVIPDYLGGGEGVWKILYAISGEGNYYDDANVFVVAGTKDSNGKSVSVCSATPCQVLVTPSLKEGIHIDASVQNLYARNKKGQMDKGVAKPFFVGLWSNLYINAKGKERIYDRTDVTPETVPDTLYSTLATDLYQGYGFVSVTPDFTSKYWKDQLALDGKQQSIDVPGAVISLTKKGIRQEKADLAFKYKTFYGGETSKTATYSIKDDDIYNLTVPFDYTKERTATGYDEITPMWHCGSSNSKIMLKCGTNITDTKEKLEIKMDFPTEVTPGCQSGWIYSTIHSIKMGQGPTGTEEVLPDGFDATVQYYYFKQVNAIIE